MDDKTWKEFNKNDLTHSAAHYLMAIEEMHEKQGYARLIDISKHLDISKGSLSTSLKPLILKGLILEDENKHLSLSKEGLAFTQHIASTCQTVTELFRDILKINPKIAEIDACKIEHLLSPESTKAMKKFLKSRS